MDDPDFYAVLELSQSATADAVRAAYRRLAKARHPDKNPGDPHATSNFQKLNNAHATLSDPLKRREYDAQYLLRRQSPSNGRNGHEQKAGAGSWTFNSKSSTQFQETEEMCKYRQRKDELAAEFQALTRRRANIGQQHSTLEEKIREHTKRLDKLRCDALRDERDEASRRGWFGFLWRLTPEQQEERDRNATSRRTGILVIEGLIDQLSSATKQQKDQLEIIEDRLRKISELKAVAEHQYDWARKREQARQEEEDKRAFAAAQREKYRREKAAQEAEERQRRNEAFKAEQERTARQAQEMRDRMKASEEAARKRREATETHEDKRKKQQGHYSARQNEKPAEDDTKGKRRNYREKICRHRAWWQKIEGPNNCQHCHKRTARFAFQCPGCKMVACAECRANLKQGK